jgi:hypothetical protein
LSSAFFAPQQEQTFALESLGLPKKYLFQGDAAPVCSNQQNSGDYNIFLLLFFSNHEGLLRRVCLF